MMRRFLSVMVPIFVGFGVSASAANNTDPCLIALNQSLSAKQIQTLLNSTVRNKIATSWKMRGALAASGLNFLASFQVTEQKHLLIDGQLPPSSRMSQVVMIRKGREAGLREMHNALFLSEERSWIFVPALDIWFYSTVGASTATDDPQNTWLRETLISQWGRVEQYHTHPWAAFDEHMKTNNFKDLAQKTDFSKEVLALLILGRPSISDQMSLLMPNKTDPLSTEPQYDNYIVHPWGITFYSMKMALRREAGGKETLLYPVLLSGTYHDLEIATREPHAYAALRAMLNEQINRSNELTASKYKSAGLAPAGLAPADLPRMIIRYEELKD